METSENFLTTLTVLLCCCVVTSSSPLAGHHDITTIAQTTKPPGCYYHNKYYPPGSQIENGYDPSSNWCYGTHCDMYGQIQTWDDFNCITTPPTTVPPTTIPTTIRPGCYYNGHYYPPGSTIEKGYDPSSNWCYSTYCDRHGQILHGDNFNCYTTLPTTTTTSIPPTHNPHAVG